MKIALFLFLVAASLMSCHTSRLITRTKTNEDSTHLVKNNTDSASVKKADTVSKHSEGVTIETKTVTKTPDSVQVKADSVKTDFRFNPNSDTTAETEVETGTIKAKVKINPRTGKGTITVIKKPQTIAVAKTEEKTMRITMSRSDSSASNHGDSTRLVKASVDSSHLKKTETVKNTKVKKPSAGITLLWIGVFGLTLLILWVVYRYRVYKKLQSKITNKITNNTT